MSNQPETNSREGAWAQPVDRLKVPDLQAGAVNLNVEGRRVTGPVQGFGQMWQKTYAIRLANSPVTPKEVIRAWKENFAGFWPQGNRFYGRSGSITPGQVAVLNLAGPSGVNVPGGTVISTGIIVIYADEESFSFMTPQGHMFAGMITFSAEREGGDTVVQIQALLRASDPLFEITFRLGFGHKMEDVFWFQTLRNLAAHFNAPPSEPQLRMVLVDPRLQWSEAKNIWHNAAIRTAFYTLGAPIRWLRGPAGGVK
ncbi:MAG: hypothetical protein IH586_03485 [Anaerolineaceae bacterium]|nr:hypothetical protein [Anaerolineaceae bacterium]